MTATGAHRDAAGTPVRGWWWWGRPRSAVLDIALAVVSALECGLEGIGFADTAGLPVPVGVLFGLVVGAVLVVRRKWPITVVLVSIAVTPAEMGFLMGMVGLYTLAASEVPRRITAALAGMSTVAVFLVTVVRLRQDVGSQDFDPSGWYVPVVSLFMTLGLNAPPVLFGLYIRARRRLMESLRERADSLEQELSLLADRAEQRAQWARQEERTRIAREMHDVVAHRVSLMVVHAAALQAVALKDPQKAVKNAALVGDMGRQALTELREMLGVLREGDGPGDSPRAPQPDIAALHELVERVRASGLDVGYETSGGVRTLSAATGATVYRIVQEALTNVVRHAHARSASVRLRYAEGVVGIVVSDDGRGAQPGSAGHGLVGIRERAAAHGGTAVTGPGPGGRGFEVRVEIPVTSAAEVGS